MLRGIDLEVAEHEVIALIGASGSGKSTLLRCINLIEPIDAGRILIEGDEITARGVNVDRIRRRVGIVFQAFNLFPHMSVLDNVTLAPRKVLGRPPADAEREALGAAASGSASRRRRATFPDRLSGGQQQRVAIVRALAMEPDLLLLDEVTSALDPELVAEVLNVVRELAAGGMTMLIATHEMGFARDIANRVCFLDEGRILEQGPPAQIFSEPREAADPPVPQPDHRGGPAVGSRGGPSGAPGVPGHPPGAGRRSDRRWAALPDRRLRRYRAVPGRWRRSRPGSFVGGRPSEWRRAPSGRPVAYRTVAPLRTGWLRAGWPGGARRRISAPGERPPAGVHEEREQPLELPWASTPSARGGTARPSGTVRPAPRTPRRGRRRRSATSPRRRSPGARSAGRTAWWW